MPTLYLIDGYAQFFRAYHAIRTPMTSPVTQEPTNMSFGFVGMLLKLLRGEGEHLQGDGAPTHIAVALDVSGDRGRSAASCTPNTRRTGTRRPRT
jgi:DNA polymerase-1